MQLLACIDSGNHPQLRSLADTLGIPLLSDSCDVSGFQYLLCTHNGELVLQPVDRSNGGPLSVNFHSAAIDYRRQHSGIRQDIARSVGCKPGYRPSVLDATAGLGGDAFVLASLGCRMTLLENNPVAYALLEDGLKRAGEAEDEIGGIVSHQLTLLPSQDAIAFLNRHPGGFDVVYLDPMFPERQKSASVKKAMQYFHDVVGFNPDQEDKLMELALQVAIKRVVVKRPKLAPLLGGREPSYQLKGKTIRYDIYLVPAAG